MEGIRLTLSRSHQSTLNIARTDKEKFKAIKGDRFEWEAFREILDFYIRHNSQSENEASEQQAA